MRKERYHIPAITRKVLGRLLEHSEKESLLGDFEESFAEIRTARSFLFAYVWLWFQVAKSLPSFMYDASYRGFAMLKNYLKTGLRTVQRHKVYSLINISGLAIGITACLLIMLFVKFELRYDTFHEKNERIYRLVYDMSGGGSTTSSAMSAAVWAEVLQEEVSGIESFVRFKTGTTETFFLKEEEIFSTNAFALVDKDFFNVFSIPLSRGEAEDVLGKPLSVVISKTFAKRVFGSENPVGKTLKYLNIVNVRVTGVMDDFPKNSHFNFEVVGSFSTLRLIDRAVLKDWEEYEFYTYLLLHRDVDAADIESTFPDFIKRHIETNLSAKGVSLNLALQPIEKIHLYSDREFELELNSSILFVYIFSAAALLILSIACFNFINLSTAKSLTRAKEVGVRKAVGAARTQLIIQFLSESSLIVFISFTIAILLTVIALPYFNTIVQRELSLALLLDVQVGAGIILFLFAVTVISGMYPAFVLSSFQISRVFKGIFSVSSSEKSIRKLLVTIQFSATAFLLIATGVVYDQYHFMNSKDPGFDKEGVAVIPLTTSQARQSSQKLKDEFMRNASVRSVGTSASVPGGKTDDKKLVRNVNAIAADTRVMQRVKVDVDFITTMGMELLAGRNFAPEIRTDQENFIVNEAGISALGFTVPTDAIDQVIQVGGSRRGKIIGVVKDFHLKSLQYAIEPAVFYQDEGKFLFARISGQNISQTVSSLEKTWTSLLPGTPFSYYFLDENMERLHRREMNMSLLFGYFAGLAILIACFGLFGLVSFSAERKTKEIGIRKVLGASIPSVISIIAKEFVILVVLANVIVWPISYLILDGWLKNFAYHTGFQASLFIYALLVSSAIALITVAYKSIKVALYNPVNTLRYE